VVRGIRDRAWRDTQHYGDRLAYEALGSKWRRYHDNHCGFGQNWVTVHAERAGFAVVRSGSGWVALTGPGLTEGVDESALTANALWEAVTGKPGTQDWYESVKVIDRSELAGAKRKAENDAYSDRPEDLFVRLPGPALDGGLGAHGRAEPEGGRLPGSRRHSWHHHRTELGITSDCSPASAIHDVVFDRVVVPADAVAGLATPDSPARRSLAGVSGLRS
jgi:hypothetical protein